jgi:hypothetical protein
VDKVLGFLGKRRSRHRIVTMTAPGVAAQYASDGQITTIDRAVFLYGFYAVCTAGRGIAAATRGMWRYNELVTPDE